MSEEQQQSTPNDEGVNGEPQGEPNRELPKPDERDARIKALEEENQRLTDISKKKSDAIGKERTLRRRMQKEVFKEQTPVSEDILSKVKEVAKRSVEDTLSEHREKEVIADFISDFPEADKKWEALEEEYQKHFKDDGVTDSKVLRQRMEFIYSLTDEDGYRAQKETLIRKEERKNTYQGFMRSAATPPSSFGRRKGDKSEITSEQKEMSSLFGLNPEEVYKDNE